MRFERAHGHKGKGSAELDPENQSLRSLLVEVMKAFQVQEADFAAEELSCEV